MRILTKMREWKGGEPTTLITLRDEDNQRLAELVTNVVVEQLKSKGLAAVTISIDLKVDAQVLLPADKPEEPKPEGERKEDEQA